MVSGSEEEEEFPPTSWLVLPIIRDQATQTGDRHLLGDLLAEAFRPEDDTRKQEVQTRPCLYREVGTQTDGIGSVAADTTERATQVDPDPLVPLVFQALKEATRGRGRL